MGIKDLPAVRHIIVAGTKSRQSGRPGGDSVRVAAGAVLRDGSAVAGRAWLHAWFEAYQEAVSLDGFSPPLTPVLGCMVVSYRYRQGMHKRAITIAARTF
jgi:hypothetical protein